MKKNKADWLGYAHIAFGAYGLLQVQAPLRYLLKGGFDIGFLPLGALFLSILLKIALVACGLLILRGSARRGLKSGLAPLVALFLLSSVNTLHALSQIGLTALTSGGVMGLLQRGLGLTYPIVASVMTLRALKSLDETEREDAAAAQAQAEAKLKAELQSTRPQTEPVGERCSICGGGIVPNAQLESSGMTSDGMFTTGGISGMLRAMANGGPTPGFRCAACGKRLCMTCMSTRGARSCPACEAELVPV